jgi:Tfp pilus assembly protein PilX
VTSFFILIALLIIGVSAARMALDGERATRAERDRHVALQSAEAALADAERDIEGGADSGSARAALFAHGSSEGFVDGCGASREVNAGLCMPSGAPAAPAWQGVSLAGDDDGRVVEYGRFTGAFMPAGAGTLPARPPRYIIELMPYARAGADAGERTSNFYRITAIGFGANPDTQVVLQTFYLKASAPEDDA